MFIARKIIGIDAGHRVPTTDSKCRNIHGHRYTVGLEVSMIQLPSAGVEAGMVADFSFLKEALVEVVEKPYDHKLILWERDPLLSRLADHTLPGVVVAPVPVIPTAEALAKFWFFQLQMWVEKKGHKAQVQRVIVEETPSSIAEYHR